MKRICHVVVTLVLIFTFAALVAELVGAVVEAYAVKDCIEQGFRGKYDPTQGCVWEKKP